VASITIDLSDQQFQRIQQLAHKLGLSPQELLRLSIDDWLSSSRNEFSQTANYVLKKNAELYKRLA
jgi:antitoxin FitA